MLWLFLPCPGSEWFCGRFADQKKYLAYFLRVFGLILWLKVCSAHVYLVNQGGFLPSISSTPPPPPTFHFL